MGAVLTQFDLSGHKHIISYASRSLSDREKRYSATEKEALAVVFATDHVRAYLLGRKFTVVTDRHALRWLHSVNPKGRLGRWVMDLQEYSFDVRHRPGNENGNADALSRLPSISSYATTVHPGYNLLQAQKDDPDIQTFLQMKSHDQPRPPFFVWAKNPNLRAFWHCWDKLHIVNGFLVKDVESSNGSIPEYAFVILPKLVVPVLNGIYSSPFLAIWELNEHCFVFTTVSFGTKWVFRSKILSTAVQNELNRNMVLITTRLLPKLLKSMSHLFSGQWITWAPYQKQPLGISTYLSSWKTLPNAVKLFTPRINAPLPLLSF